MKPVVRTRVRTWNENAAALRCSSPTGSEGARSGGHVGFQAGLSTWKISSTRRLNKRAMATARESDGLFRPVSIALTVCLDTLSRSASSPWDRAASVRSIRTSFRTACKVRFTGRPCQVCFTVREYASSMTQQPSGTPSGRRFDIEMSPEIETGIWADFASLWHTSDSFVIDFAALRRPPYASTDPDTGKVTGVMPARIVARIRIPPSQVFEFMKALEQQLSMWEKETGRRTPPTQPPPPSPADQ